MLSLDVLMMVVAVRAFWIAPQRKKVFEFLEVAKSAQSDAPSQTQRISNSDVAS